MLLAGFMLPGVHQTVGPAGGVAAQFLLMQGVPLVVGLGLAARFARLTRRGLVAGLVVALLTAFLPVLGPALVLVTPLLAAPPTAEARRRGTGRLVTGLLVLIPALVVGFITGGRLLAGR